MLIGLALNVLISFRALGFKQTAFLRVYLDNKILGGLGAAFINTGRILAGDSTVRSPTPISPSKLRFLRANFCSFDKLLINVVNIMASLHCLDRHSTFYKYEVECNTGAICLCNKPWTDSGFKIKTNVSDV